MKMEKLEVTSLSSRGQVVIPQDIRDHLKLKTGEKFVVLGDEDTIILKKIKMPSSVKQLADLVAGSVPVRPEFRTDNYFFYSIW